MLLTRDQFREDCLKRDRHRCVICQSEKGLSVHHIIERKLFSDGGYYLDNGATLCEAHHFEAETTQLSCLDIRAAAGIKSIVLPEHFPIGGDVDKWGNPILENGMRMPGELFWDENVQKVLAAGQCLGLFTRYVKYPRTFHVPWSPGISSDDKVQHDLSFFHNKRVIVTVKCDGENSSLYRDYLHARSIESQNKRHPSRDLLKTLHAQIKSDIPEGWRICGENLYAKHAIHYKNLAAYFLVFSIWNERNIALSWDETVEWCGLLGLKMVPVLYDGIYLENKIRSLYQTHLDGDEMEGYCIRIADEFHYKDFRNCCVKYVRAGHVEQNSTHWLNQEVIPNIVKK